MYDAIQSYNQIGQGQPLLLAQKNVKDLMKLRAWAEEGSFRSAIKVSQGNHFLKSLVFSLKKLCYNDNLLDRIWGKMSVNQTLYQYIVISSRALYSSCTLP